MNGNERQVLLNWNRYISRIIRERKDLTPAKKMDAIIDLCGRIEDFLMLVEVVE